MQRKVEDGIVIACDFCGTDWDQVRPMIEGHHGSVLCLECLKLALALAAPAAAAFQCTLCLHQRPAGTRAYQPIHRPAQANPQAAVCDDCVQQAARVFERDADVNWRRDSAASQRG